MSLSRRGRLREGYFADVAVFDAGSVQDHATLAVPLAHPGGFVLVLVNGRPVVSEGMRNAECPGVVLRGASQGA